VFPTRQRRAFGLYRQGKLQIAKREAYRGKKETSRGISLLTRRDGGALRTRREEGREAFVEDLLVGKPSSNQGGRDDTRGKK